MSLVAVAAVPFAGRVAGAATVPPRPLLITPTSFDFGEIFVDETSAPQEVVVRNVSGAAVTLSSVSVGTPSSAQFAAGTTTCTAGAVLAAGATCTVPYSFSPAPPVASPVTATSTLSVNGQVATIGLRGTALAPFLVTPTGLDFGPVEDSQTGSAQQVFVTNVSTRNRPVTVTSTVTSGPFATSAAINETLLPGQRVWVGFTFSPTVAGVADGTATVTVRDSAGPTPRDWQYAVTLTGRGASFGASGVQLTASAVDFGGEFVGFASPQDGGTLRGFGDGSYTIDSIAGPASTVFQAVGDCAPGKVLTPTSPSCDLLYVFVPTGPGVVQDQVVVNVLQGVRSYPVTLRLTGTGRSAFIVTPTGFDFGDVAPGATVPAQLVTVTNLTSQARPTQQVRSEVVSANGLPALTVVTAAGNAAAPFTATSRCDGVTLVAGTSGASCTVDYTVGSSAFGTFSSTAAGVLTYRAALPATAMEVAAGQPVDGVISVQPFSVRLAATVLDPVAPSITVAVTPAAPAASGWYNTATGAPTVSFTCTDPAPGTIASCTGPTTLSSGPAAQTVTGTAVDGAGNTATVTSPALLVDLVAPSIACPATPTFVAGTAATLTATVTDADSGPTAATVSATAATSTTGTQAVTLAATDVAGNTARASCPYAVASALPPTGGSPLPTLLLGAFLAGAGAMLLLGSRRVARR